MSPSKVILVVGHGVAGKLTSAALAKAGGARILVVESREFWEADVMSPVLLSRPEAYAKFSGGQAVARLPGVSYVQGVVTRLDRLEGGRYGVGLATGEMLKVDAVVLAVGSTLPLLKPAVGATRMERDAELASARKAIGEAQTILIGGGGSVGVEIAGAVAELKQPSAKVTLVVSGATVLSDGFPSGTRERLAAHMRSKGVEIVPNEKVVSPQPLSFADRKATYTLSSGKTLEADCFLPGFCSFSVPFMAAHKGAVDARGKIVVDAALQVCSHRIPQGISPHLTHALTLLSSYRPCPSPAERCAARRLRRGLLNGRRHAQHARDPGTGQKRRPERARLPSRGAARAARRPGRAQVRSGAVGASSPSTSPPPPPRPLPPPATPRPCPPPDRLLLLLGALPVGSLLALEPARADGRVCPLLRLALPVLLLLPRLLHALRLLMLPARRPGPEPVFPDHDVLLEGSAGDGHPGQAGHPDGAHARGDGGARADVNLRVFERGCWRSRRGWCEICVREREREGVAAYLFGQQARRPRSDERGTLNDD